MSLSSTLANALSGLGAASRSAQVVSTNVANATNEDYGRREIELSSRSVTGIGAGVRVDGIVRIVDENILRERRLAAASVAGSSEVAGFNSGVLAYIGQPEDPSSLAARAAGLESAFLEATSRPESDSRLQAVLNAAHSLADKLNASSDFVQQARQDADRALVEAVRGLNSRLEQIADLNGQILRAWASDENYPSLLDNRQKLIDEVSELVPVRLLPRDNDTVALYSVNGALLLDSRPAEFGFTGSPTIDPEMTLAGGTLSGLTINGNAVNTSGTQSPISGGKLAGLFEVRDELAPAFQENLDAVARDLISRFEDPSLDTSLPLGDPGLFTDAGGVLDPLSTIGLSRRISVNGIVDPAQGGEVWRLRDGIGAAAPGSVGDASLLTDMLDRLQERRAPVGGAFSPTERSVANLITDMTSLAGQSVQISNDRLAFNQAQFAGLDGALLADGVDTDQELQKLLLIEQSYAANARVIQTTDELLQLLIGL